MEQYIQALIVKLYSQKPVLSDHLKQDIIFGVPNNMRLTTCISKRVLNVAKGTIVNVATCGTETAKLNAESLYLKLILETFGQLMHTMPHQPLGRVEDSRVNVICFYFPTVPAVLGEMPGN